MKRNNIFILSQPVQTGKTTLLQKWISGQPNIGGILTPDENGARKLLNITTGKLYDLQLDAHAQGLKIGKFVFDETIFAAGNEMLLQAFSENRDWIVVDEIGKLELFQNKGLAASASPIITHFRGNETRTNLLLVIRDYLLDDAIAHYGLRQAKILSASFFRGKPHRKLNGIVLCGGNSSRMKTDKAFISYHQKPQYAHVSGLLTHFCDDVFLSVNERQDQVLTTEKNKVIDNKAFGDAGPLSGLLSVIESRPAESMMVAGCDYPYLKRRDLLQLFNERDDETEAVCFINDENFAEPLITVYEACCFIKMKEFYKEGGRSLRQFLHTISTKFIHPKNALCLTSIDCEEKMIDFKNAARP
ncbi:MAG TPA: NTP transferase domain-containing protein [Flavipsychrobacter sp.]|nr:NTP transferase domain-containing protein [Flavipsychrobacter sp.]